MTRRVFRWAVPVDGHSHHFDLTGGLLHVEAASDTLVEFWAEKDDAQPAHRRAFQVFGTGHDLPDEAAWCGTTDRTRGGFVWHLFEVAP